MRYTPMTEFQTETGHCTITEDEIHIARSWITILKRTIESNKKASFVLVVGPMLLFLLETVDPDGSVIGTFRLLGILLAITAIVTVIGTALRNRYRHHQRTKNGDMPKELVTSGTIPRKDITSVDETRFLNNPCLLVRFDQDGLEKAGVIMFRDGNKRFDNAKTTFHSEGMQVVEQ